MHIEEMLLKLGIPTYTDTYYTKLDGTPGQVKIGQDMPKPIGWIYGLSVNPEGTQPTNVGLSIVGEGDLQKLWLYLKLGPDVYVNNYRLDNLNFLSVKNQDYSNPSRYKPVGVPNVTDLKESYYYNPSGLANVFVPLTVHYINKESYDLLVQKGYLFRDVKALPQAKH